MWKDKAEEAKEGESVSEPSPQDKPRVGEDAPADALSSDDARALEPTEDPPRAISLSPEDYEGLKKKADERDLYRNELLRAKADFENFQKRIRKERPAWEVQAVRRFLRDLLPVLDNFERALAKSGGKELNVDSLEEGVRLTHQILQQTLIDQGVEEILTEGETFNPEVHEAVAEAEVVDLPTGRIVEVLEKGYRHGNTVLRPSKVKVARRVESGKTV